MHFEESGKIIEVLNQMESAVHYLAEHVDWESSYAQERFELFSWVCVYLCDTAETLRQLDGKHDGSLMKFLCHSCSSDLRMISEEGDNPNSDAACSDCRDKMTAAISITMNKRLKAALTEKEV